MKRSKIRITTYALITAFFTVGVILPILSMFTRITPEGFRTVVSSAQFGSAIRNSVSTALVSTVISLILALTAAYCIERSSIRLRIFFSIIFVMPMLIPSISHAFGLVALFGTNGLLTKFFGLRSTIYGFNGIVAGSVSYSFPVAFLMFDSILQYEDGSPHKAAVVLGIPSYRRFCDITLPFMKKTLISAFFAIFTIIITDYGIALMIGGHVQTLPVLMYNKAVAMTDYSSGSVIGLFLLVPAVIAFIIDLVYPERAQNTFSMEPVMRETGRLNLIFSYCFSIIISMMILAPVISFCIMVFETKYPVNPAFTLYHIQKTINRGALTYLSNSFIYAVLTSFFGTCLAFVCAYQTARIKGRFSRGLNLIALTSMAIPGVVLGLSYIIFFHKSPIYGTAAIMTLVNCVHFFSSPYLMMYNTLGKLNPNLEAVGLTLGINRVHMIFSVIIPKVRYTLLEMSGYFFVNSMMTISAVSFLAPPAPKPIALMINTFEAQRQMESAAFVSILIFLVNLIVRLVVERRRLFSNVK